jgi:phage/plasmid-associated DNA primase
MPQHTIYYRREELEAAVDVSTHHIFAQDLKEGQASKGFIAFNRNAPTEMELMHSALAEDNHLYEIIYPTSIIKPYFDLEIETDEANHLKFGLLFIDATIQYISTKYFIELEIEDFAVFDSCRAGKLSYHLLVQNKICFKSMAHHKVFVADLFKHILQTQPSLVWGIKNEKTVLDKLPYSHCQNFRLPNQSKKGKGHILKNSCDVPISDCFVTLWNGAGTRSVLKPVDSVAEVVTDDEVVEVEKADTICDVKEHEKWVDLIMNVIKNEACGGVRLVSRAQWFQVCGILKTNEFDRKVWLDWSKLSSQTDTALKQWNRLNCDYVMSIFGLQNIAKDVNPDGYKKWLQGSELKTETKQIEKSSLTLNILEKGIRDTIDACYMKMVRLKFCKNQWYYCRAETNLWECVKNPNLYMVRIVQNEINLLIAGISADICNSSGKERDELEQERKKVLGHYPSIAGTSFQSNAVKFLCDLLLDNKFAEKLDANKGFLAFKNGILNLRSREFTDGLLPEHYITFTLDRNYKPLGCDIVKTSEVWKQFKKVLNNSDIELDYFMSIVGHAFTGECIDVKHLYFMIDGSGDSRGDNGKTFLFKLLSWAGGAYVAKPKSSLLEKNNMKTHKQIVGLKGKRFVYMEEFPDKALNVDLLKELADGGAMENEIMFGTTETINIMAMFFVLSNHTPNLDANESAGYNRYKEVSFCSHFDRTGEREAEDEAKLEYIADPKLGDLIIRDHGDELVELILQYAVRYYKSGIPRTPVRFLKAEQKTKKANDEFLEWFEEFIDGNEDDRIAERQIMEMSKLDAKKVRKGMSRLGYKYDKDLSGIGKDLSTGKWYKGGYVLEK